MLDLNQKSYRYVLPLKNWVDWIRNRQEKNVTTFKNVHFEKKVVKVKKHDYVPQSCS